MARSVDGATGGAAGRSTGGAVGDATGGSAVGAAVGATAARWCATAQMQERNERAAEPATFNQTHIKHMMHDTDTRRVSLEVTFHFD
jgi:hypothetical protein